MSDLEQPGQGSFALRSIFNLRPYSFKVKILLASENMIIDEQYLHFLRRALTLAQQLGPLKKQYPLAHQEITDAFDTFLLKITNTTINYTKADAFFTKMQELIRGLDQVPLSSLDDDEVDNLINSLSSNLKIIQRREQQTKRLKALLREAEDMQKEINTKDLFDSNLTEEEDHG